MFFAFEMRLATYELTNEQSNERPVNLTGDGNNLINRYHPTTLQCPIKCSNNASLIDWAAWIRRIRIEVR